MQWLQPHAVRIRHRSQTRPRFDLPNHRADVAELATWERPAGKPAISAALYLIQAFEFDRGGFAKAAKLKHLTLKFQSLARLSKNRAKPGSFTWFQRVRVETVRF